MSVLPDEFSAESGDRLEMDIGLRDHFAPVFARRRCEAGGKNTPLGSFRVGEYE